jgi:hypothetical protein
VRWKHTGFGQNKGHTTDIQTHRDSGQCPLSGILNNIKKHRFGNWICFRLHVWWEKPTLSGPLERANLKQVVQWLGLALSKRPNKAGISLSLSLPTWRRKLVRFPKRRVFYYLGLLLWSKFVVTDPEVRVRFSTLPHFLRSSGSGTGSTQPREYNWGATWKEK